MDVLVRAPKIMRLTLGGISIPSVAAEAIVPRTSFSLYLRLRNSGNATVEIVAAVATEEPDTAAKIALAPILECSSPPGSGDNHSASV